jgi:hypothetical protein
MLIHAFHNLSVACAIWAKYEQDHVSVLKCKQDLNDKAQL